MSPFFYQLSTILATQPGNFIYHVVLGFTLASVLLNLMSVSQKHGSYRNIRWVIGISFLFGIQFLLFIISFLLWIGVIGTSLIIPAFDRAVNLISLIWIVWLLTFPKPNKITDLSLSGLTAFSLIMFGITSITLPQTGMIYFNTTSWELFWQITSVVVCVLGFIIIYSKRMIGWENAIVLLILASGGHLSSIIWRVEGNYPGILRIAHLAMFPILFTLTQSTSLINADNNRSLFRGVMGRISDSDRGRQFYVDLKTFQSLINLSNEASTEYIFQSLAVGFAHAIKADFCTLIRPGEEDTLVLVHSYDLSCEENIDQVIVQESIIPLLFNAVNTSLPLFLSINEASADLSGLCSVLNVSLPKQAIYMPIASSKEYPIGGILFLSNNPVQQWNSEDQNYIMSMSPLFLQIAERIDFISTLTEERDSARQEAQRVNKALLELKDQIERKNYSELYPLEISDQLKLRSEKENTLQAMLDESQKKIEQLYRDMEEFRIENEELRNAALTLNTDDVIDKNLNQTMKELSDLHSTLAISNDRIKELESEAIDFFRDDQIKIVSTFTKDLRQLMYAVEDTIDLLLGESIGELSPLQRIFVNRLKGSSEVIGSLTNDLYQIIIIDFGKLEFSHDVIELDLLIDTAMGYSSTTLREKNLALRIDIPEISSEIRTDSEALQQIVNHLLQNAFLISSPAGIVTFRLEVQEEGSTRHLLIQITDSGGGIKQEDLPLVFEKHIQPGQTIEGVGDTGVGLWITRSLVEAQGGKIWVVPQPGVGSTYSINLPIP